MWTNPSATASVEEGDVISSLPVPPVRAAQNNVRMMTIPDILKELEPYTGKFPMKAMRATIEIGNTDCVAIVAGVDTRRSGLQVQVASSLIDK